MRSALFAFAAALSVFSGPAWSADKPFASADEVQSMITAKKSGPLASLAPYQAHLDVRTGPQSARANAKEAELIQIVQGRGTLILGGTRLPVEKGAAVFVPAGTSYRFTDIDGALASISIRMAGGDSPADPAKTKIFASVADVRALIAAGKNDTLVAVPPYRTVLQNRKEPQNALMHHHDAEFVYIAEGSGTFTVGGTLTDAKPTTPGNFSGSGITGGTPYKVAPGAVIFVPSDTPHQFSGITGVLISSDLHLPRGDDARTPR